MLLLSKDTTSSVCVARYRYMHMLETGTYTDEKFGSIDLDNIITDHHSALYKTGDIWFNVNSLAGDGSDVVWFDGM